MASNDGGPAFPQPQTVTDGGVSHAGVEQVFG